MDKKEIKEFFDKFCSLNKTEMTPYSYYFYYLNELNARNCNILIDDKYDAIFPYYFFNKKYKFSYLPLIKDKIGSNYKEIICRFIDKVKQFKGEKSNRILFVPNSVKENLLAFKLQKTDESFIYDTKNFVDLTGREHKNIRRGHTYFEKEFPNIKVVGLNDSHISQIIKLHDEWKVDAKNRYFRLFGSSAYSNWIKNSLNNENEQHNYVIVNENNKVLGVEGFYSPYKESNRVDLFMLNYKHWEYSDIGKYFLVETYRDLYEKGVLSVNAGGSSGAKNLYFFKEVCKPKEIIQNYSLVMW